MNSEERYTETRFLARYVEAEWGDLLIECQLAPHGELFSFGQRTIPFYTQVLDFIERHGIRPRRILDAGSATGRLVRELSRLYPEAEEIVGCEPSKRFHALSRQILGMDEPTEERLPIPSSPLQACQYIRIDARFRQAVSDGLAGERVHLINCPVQSVPRPKSYFDLACCLNVVDRTQDPQQVVEALGKHLRSGGFLVLSSPLDWEEEITLPNKRTDDLKDYLRNPGWHVESKTDLEYAFRYNNRKVVSFCSQVLLVQKS